jgi:hypothetical protein
VYGISSRSRCGVASITIVGEPLIQLDMLKYEKIPSLHFIHRDDMAAQGYEAYLDQVEDIR